MIAKDSNFVWGLSDEYKWSGCTGYRSQQGAATKAAAMSLTECLRFEMRDKSVEVFGVYAGFIDTDMTGSIVGDKASPREIARNTMLGMEAGT